MKFGKHYINLKSNDAKILIGNFAWLSILKLTSFLLPLITLPYLSKVIGLDCFGYIAFASSVVYFMELFTDFGFNYTATREVARNRDDRNSVNQVFSTVFWAKTLLMTISFIFLVIIILVFPDCRAHSTLLFLTFLYIPGHIIFPDWFFQAMEDMKYITILNVISKLFFTLMVFVVIKSKDDYIYQPLLNACGYIISGFLSLLFIKYRYGVSISFISFNHVLGTIRAGFNMFICQFVPSLYSNMSVILLQTFGGPQSSGIFSSGKKFPDIVSQISGLLSRVFYPFLVRRIEKHKVYVAINLTVSLILGLGLFLCADTLVALFYTEEFVESAIVIKIFAISIPFSFIELSYGNNYLVVIGKEDLLRNNIFIGTGIGTVVMIVLIMKFGYVGAAFTFLITRVYFAISNLLLSWYTNKSV